MSFGEKLKEEKFDFPKNVNVAEVVQDFQDKMQRMVENTFPEKQITINSDDKPYFTENLRLLKRQRQREYYKHGRSEKYKKMKIDFDEKLCNEKMKYIQKM